MVTVSLRCKSCDGVLEIDDDREILFCPYCGSKELFLESDAIKVERMRTKAYRDVELGAQETAKELQMNEYEYKKWQEEFKYEKKKQEDRTGLRVSLGIVFGIIYFDFLLFCLIEKHYGLLIGSIFVIALVVSAIVYCWIKLIKPKNKN